MSDSFTLAGFDILEKLGAGGMATVWKARQLSLDRPVAIKVLSGMARDVDDIRRFEEEARSAAKLKHQGIVQVYDANVSDGNSYIVMEYVSGYTVGEWVRKKGKLSVDDALSVAECVAEALGYAWKREGLIHCDIKPDNVMVDGDGTVKVADLGLARTIRAMGEMEEVDEIMGTPAYISPEQAIGAPDLDCRADIYSLGATLYHLMTGRLMFQGRSEEEALEAQVNDYVEDPGEVNPKLPVAVCWLLERMLSKDRELRPADWHEVLSDIRRVRSGRLPSGCSQLGEGLSTVRRSASRVLPQVAAHDVASNVSRLQHERATDHSRLPMIFLLLLLLVLTAGVFMLLRGGALDGPAAHDAPAAPSAPIGNAPTVPVDDAASRKARKVRDALRETLRWFREHPDRYDDALGRLAIVQKAALGTEYATKVRRAQAEILRRRDEARATIESELEGLIKPLVASGSFEEAAGVMDAYDGKLSELTQAWRTKRARALREHGAQVAAATAQAAVGAAEAFQSEMSLVVADLLAVRYAEAERRCRAAIQAAGPHTDGVDCEAIIVHLAGARQMDAKILDSFRAQRGSDVVVHLSDSEPLSMRIDSVTGEQVTAKIQMTDRYAFRTLTFGVSDLAARERLQRMGKDDEAGVALVKGGMAVAAGAFDHARRFYSLAPPALSRLLVPALDSMESSAEETRMEADLRHLLQGFGVSVDDHPRAGWLKAVRALPAGSLSEDRVDAAVTEFRRLHGATEQGVAVDPILVALRKKAASVGGADPMAVFDNGFLEVPSVRLDAAPEIEPVRLAVRPGLEPYRDDPIAVQARLIADNPGLGAGYVRVGQGRFDGGWSGERVDLSDGRVRNIEAVKALGGLRGFQYAAAGGKPGMLVSLLDLRGLPLDYIRVVGCAGVELSALAGMPLQYAAFPDCSISDLTPLAGAPLMAADLSGTRVADLQPLVGTPLRHLLLDRSQVTRLETVAELELDVLSLADTRIVDFEPLERMSALRYLSVARTGFRDLVHIRSWRLRGLDLSGTRIRDIHRLAQRPLRQLSLAETSIKEFAALGMMELEVLDLSGTSIGDLTALAGCRLVRLKLADTRVDDLSALVGMPLTHLSIRNTHVQSLRPLGQSPLEVLDIRGVPAQDLHTLPLGSLVSLAIDHPEVHAPAIREMPNLRFLNGVDLMRASGSPFSRVSR